MPATQRLLEINTPLVRVGSRVRFTPAAPLNPLKTGTFPLRLGDQSRPKSRERNVIPRPDPGEIRGPIRPLYRRSRHRLPFCSTVGLPREAP